MRWLFRILANVLPPLAVLATLLGVAEWLIVHYQVPRYFLPRPSDVLSALLGPWKQPPAHGIDFSAERIQGWLISTGKTAAAAGCAFVASAILGILIAIILSTSRWTERAFYPFTIFFQTVPVVAVAPMLTIWCGAGFRAVALCGLIVSIFPVIANTLAGFASVDPALRDLFKLYGAASTTRLLKLRLPWALPNIFTGLKIAAGLAVIGVIVGELVAGWVEPNNPLGIIIVESKKVGRTDRVFAAIALASLLGLVMLWLVQFCSWLVLRKWHASEKI